MDEDYIILSSFLQLYSDPVHLIQCGGIILVLAIIYLETGFFLGLVLPGIPMLAGASGISLIRFSYLNVIGAVIWIGSLTPIGYNFSKAYPNLINYSIYFLIIFIVIASIPMLKIINPFQKLNR